ncbi:hypothetical protein BMUNKI379_02290 [Burkholderia multivorans]|uniref:toll/interleukin-1 receptor domain-containing protein n=1 Tax=Burkholderia multivorans TaxID=87883 RepID=UPI0006C77EC0|nr:toll/interleukin-1 receptor domain-containing protein [Burkholderia multivorans]KPJ36540.1 hypothetical protein BMUNKI379_02290 [Burkholderia multivorans]
MFLDLRVEDFRAGLLQWSSREVADYGGRGGDVVIALEKYLMNRKNTLDASLIEAGVFPSQAVDVFISHSHRDRDEAIRLALSLESRGLSVFVDSCVWGHVDALLRKIDDEFCVPDGWKHYSYPLRNRTTSNVHMILNSALHGMIDRAELLIFLDSANSVRVEDYVNESEYLSSPWIFSELMFAGRVRRRPRKKLVLSAESMVFDGVTASTRGEPEFLYPVPKLNCSIRFDDLVKWLNEDQQSGSGHPGLDGLEHLDRLYRKLQVPERLLKDPRIDA